MAYLAWFNYTKITKGKVEKEMNNLEDYFESEVESESNQRSHNIKMEFQRNNTLEENYMSQGGQGMI